MALSRSKTEERGNSLFKEFLQRRVETLFFENTNKQASKRKNKFYSINQSTLFKNEGKRITAEADKPEALQLN